MKRAVIIPAAGLLLLAVTLTGIYFAQPPSALSAMTARVQQLEQDLESARSENLQLKSEREKLLADKQSGTASRHRVTLGTEPGAASSSPSTQPPDSAATTASASSGAGKSPADTPRRAIDISRTLETLSGVQAQRIDTTYGRLFKQMGLNAEEQDYFHKLLAERERKQTELTFKQANASIEKKSSGSSQANKDERDRALKESDDMIRQFLNNDEDFQSFQQWDGTKTERYDVQVLAGSLDALGEPMSAEQREQLINVVASVRKESRQAPTPKTSPGTPRPNGLLLYQQRREAENEKILQLAAAFLTPEQIAAARRAQQNQQAILRVPSDPKK